MMISWAKAALRTTGLAAAPKRTGAAPVMSQRKQLVQVAEVTVLRRAGGGSSEGSGVQTPCCVKQRTHTLVAQLLNTVT